MSTLVKIDTYRIPSWALPVLINGDTSDLSGTEEDLLEQFVLEFQDRYEGLVFDAQGEPYFATSNDVVNQCGEVYDVDVYGHEIV